MAKWENIPLEKLFQNVQESVLTRASAALENCFQNETKGFTRFPGLLPRITLGGTGRVYLSQFQGDLLAVCNGQVYRIDSSLTATDVTGVPVAGNGRVIFALGEDEMLMAAGKEIVRFNGPATSLLSADAPLATHVAYTSSYVVANEAGSGRFFHSATGDSPSWSALDVFATDSQPDNVTALAVSPYRELLVAGPLSVEQYERLTTGDVPFFLRWAVGEGILAPYTFISTKDGNWGINNREEFVRFTGQVSQSLGDDIGMTLEGVTDWTDAWTVQMNLRGQKFILLQIPNAENPYGTIGITALFDFRQNKWFNLYGWNADLGLPDRWPGWSHEHCFSRHFVGGEGVIYELDDSTFTNAGLTQRVLGRTAHIDQFGDVTIDNVQMRIKRGIVSSSAAEPVIALRCLRDNKTYTRWIYKGLGKSGDKNMNLQFGSMGQANTFQFEWMVTDACELEVMGLQAQFTPTMD